jgi:DNA-directed RNA polymerase specialized sigma subunit
LSDNAAKVKRLLSSYHALVERQYAGDSDAICILADLRDAIDGAKLTRRQREVLYYVYIKDMTQEEASNIIGIARQNVGIYADNSIAKITAVYEEKGSSIVDCDGIFD